MLGLTWLEIQGFCCDFFRNSSKSAEKRRDHQHKRLIENGITSRKLGDGYGKRKNAWVQRDIHIYMTHYMTHKWWELRTSSAFLQTWMGTLGTPKLQPMTQAPQVPSFFSGRQGIRPYGDPPKRDGASRITMEDRKPKGFQPTGLDQLDRIGSRETKHWISWNGVPPF